MIKLINKLKNRKGFTLIELIVVLAVLAIIMAIAIPRFTGVREQAKVDSDAATLASIAKLAELEHVRQNKTGAATLEKNTVDKLIYENFSESKPFQSNTLKNFSVSAAETTDADDKASVTFVDGKVQTITIGTLGTFTYDSTTGKFEQ